MKQDVILKVTGVFSAAVIASCVLYKSAQLFSENTDAIRDFSIKSVLYMNAENYKNDSFGNDTERWDKLSEPLPSDKEPSEDESEPQSSSTPQSIDESSSGSNEMVLSGAETAAGISVKNSASGVSVDFNEELEAPLDISAAADGTPTVLIYHTHTSECYKSDSDELTRSGDTSRNVVAVGEAAANVLRSYGIGVIHDTTVYDETYTGSYYRSEDAVREILADNPGIDITIDLHRDSLQSASGEKIKPTAVIDGKKSAQIMIMAGCDSDGSLNFPDWRENLRFALKLQKSLSDISPELVRPLYFLNGVYNMNLTPASIIAEVGTDANYPQEAVYAGSLLGEALSNEILELCG